jgi:hypothetical protein
MAMDLDAVRVHDAHVKERNREYQKNGKRFDEFHLLFLWRMP